MLECVSLWVLKTSAASRWVEETPAVGLWVTSTSAANTNLINFASYFRTIFEFWTRLLNWNSPHHFMVDFRILLIFSG